MNKVLITGITGQDGIFLTEKILSSQPQTQIYGISRSYNFQSFFEKIQFLNKKINLDNIEMLNIDLKSHEDTNNIIRDIKPNSLYNLMGPSSVSNSIGNDKYYYENLENSFENIVNSIIKNKIKTKIFQASSSEMFANSEKKLDENSKFLPRNPYSKSKFSIHNKIQFLRKEEGLNICSGIMFNHESEFRPSNFLLMKIVSQAIDIKKSKIKKIKVGSLDYVRDWSFAKDITDAAFLITEQDHLQDYVLGSGKGTKIQQILEYVFSSLDLVWSDFVEVDDSILRKNDPVSIISNPIKIKNDLDWQVTHSFENILDRIINFLTNNDSDM